LGPLEQATGDIAAPEDRWLSMDLNDIYALSCCEVMGRCCVKDPITGVE